MTPTSIRCADCGKISELVKCSKEGCSNVSVRANPRLTSADASRPKRQG